MLRRSRGNGTFAPGRYLIASETVEDRKNVRKKPKEPALWGVPAAAVELGIDAKSVRKAITDGTIPAIQIGRTPKIPLWWICQQRDGITPGKAA